MRTTGVGTVISRLSLEALAALAEIPEEQLRRELRKRGWSPGGRGGGWVRWEDATALLPQSLLRQIRAELRALGFQPRSSKTTVAGYPRLLAEWHTDKNGELTPWEVSYGSNRRLWWRCPKGPDHIWQATAGNRTQGTGCPFCRGFRVSVTNSLATQAPGVAAEWHPCRNGSLTPASVTTGSQRRVWWQCTHQHAWRTSVANRVGQNTGCPYCANKRANEENALSSTHPGLAAEWHPEKNGELTPHEVVAGHDTPVWWQCQRAPDHAWCVSPAQRTRERTGCPFCRNRRLSTTNSLAALHPGLAAQWHPSRNGSLTPRDVVATASTPVWWRCPEGHEWQAPPGRRVHAGAGCPVCGGVRTSLEGSVAKAIPAVAKQWHPTRNKGLLPSEVSAGSSLRIWWQCPEGPDHVWQSSPRQRRRSPGCPFCSGKKRSSTNNLARLYPRLAREWDREGNGGLLPSQIRAHDRTPRAWICSTNPSHRWSAPPALRTRRGSGCPSCDGKQASPERSLAARAPVLAAQWHPTKNGALTPDKVAVTSTRAVWWCCTEDPEHEWEASPNSRFRTKGHCPFCLGRRASATNNLAVVAPAVASEWHPRRNAPRTPRDVPPGSGFRAWWRCAAGHEWQARVDQRVKQGVGCLRCWRLGKRG